MDNSVTVSRYDWSKVVKRYLGTSDFEILKCTLRSLGAGSGFLGEHRLADVTVRTPADENKTVSLHFFLKTSPQLESQRIASEQLGTFKREVDVLSDLFVELRSVLNNSGQDMSWMCECYLARDDVIVLDDLSIQGFKTIAIREPIEYNHAVLVLKELANLHSASLIYEEKYPKQPFRLDSTYGHMLQECFFKNDPKHPGFKYLESSVQGTLHLIRRLISEEHYLEIQEKVRRTTLSVPDFQRPSLKFRNVVSHGDLWRNNILFREENGKPVAARLIDFQLVRYAPPANDVMSFLYLSSDRSFRDQYATKLISEYYDHLSHNLKEHGLSAANILPWEQFSESCDFYKTLGVSLAPCYKQFILMKPDSLKDVFKSSGSFDTWLSGDRRESLEKAFNEDCEYCSKIKDVLFELIELAEKE